MSKDNYMQVGSYCRLKKNKLILLLVLLSCFFSNLFPQLYEDVTIEDWDSQYSFGEETKSASKAMILSAVFPGSGHFYANKRSVGTYLFPLIEIALWTGIFVYTNKGDDIEKDYMSFANQHYRREYYNEVSTKLIEHSQSSSIYTELHFRLDKTNTQHFYEDIGKYNKYIFGWTDWYEKYVDQSTKQIRWVFDDKGIWLGNYPFNNGDNSTYDIPYSEIRAEYIRLRREAQDNYDTSHLMKFGLVINRIGSSLDAARVVSKYNREICYGYNFNIKLSPRLTNNLLTPTLTFVVNY